MKVKSKIKINFQGKRQKAKGKNMRLFNGSLFGYGRAIFAFLLLPFAFVPGQAQEQPPTPSAPRAAKIPSVVEKKMANGLKVATVERKNVPLVTVHLSVRTGANGESADQAGLANLTASMLTKGTKTRTATQIAEQIEFLGGSITTGAGWNNSVVAITVTSDKLEAAMAILADVVLNPKFDQKELDLLKSQTLDGLSYNLKQPGFLANYVASKYSFGEHPAGGTPETIARITTADVAKFKANKYTPDNAVLIFTGDITAARASLLAQRHFGKWKMPATIDDSSDIPPLPPSNPKNKPAGEILKRILVVDLPDSGQASVNYTVPIKSGRAGVCLKPNECESNEIFYPALVMNSVLGGGYSSRLNQEIRIKRGLSYGAGSNFAWRFESANFSTSTQTKNESAAEVAELVLAEIKKITEASISLSELAPRKLVLTGDFGRELETTATLAQTVAALYTYMLPLSDLNTHIQKVNAVSEAQIRNLASERLKNGDLVIVGDYKIFASDLKKRFPNTEIQVIGSAEFSPNQPATSSN